MPREASVQEAARRLVVARGGWIVKGNPTLGAGVPDLLACYRGRFLGLEVKQPGQKPTRLQLHVLGRIEAAGGAAGIVRSKADVERILDAIDAGEDPRLQTCRW